MTDELTQTLMDYRAKWEKLVSTRRDKAFFEAARPTAVAWKMVDIDDFDKRFAALRDHCDQIHFGWVNERWLATLHLKDITLPWGIEVVKLFQRRPGSADPVGLDHVDFIVPEGGDTKALLEAEGLKWTEETNGAHCKWLSVWFDDTEAKLRTDTVLQVCADELLECQAEVLRKPAV